MDRKEELIELTLHRALRGELAPSIAAIRAQITADVLVVHVFHGGGLDEQLFAETIEAEIDQVVPDGLDSPRTRFEFHDASHVVSEEPIGIRIYVNYWSRSFPEAGRLSGG